MTETTTPLADPPSKLHKHQFDYAWKWFCFHADQRIKMFNYMLIVFGIFAAGIVNALGRELPNAAIATLCFVAGTLALIFTLLDRRNRDLVWLGEDVLMHLERDAIFGTNEMIAGRYDKQIPFGILWRQALEQKSNTWGRIFVQLEQAPQRWKARLGRVLRWPLDKLYDAWHGKHRIWLRGVGLLIAVLFFAAGFLVLQFGPKIDPASGAV